MVEVCKVGYLNVPEMSQTRTVPSKEAETTKSSVGWNFADIT